MPWSVALLLAATQVAAPPTSTVKSPIRALDASGGHRIQWEQTSRHRFQLRFDGTLEPLRLSERDLDGTPDLGTDADGRTTVSFIRGGTVNTFDPLRQTTRRVGTLQHATAVSESRGRFVVAFAHGGLAFVDRAGHSKRIPPPFYAPQPADPEFDERATYVNQTQGLELAGGSYALAQWETQDGDSGRTVLWYGHFGRRPVAQIAGHNSVNQGTEIRSPVITPQWIYVVITGIGASAGVSIERVSPSRRTQEIDNLGASTLEDDEITSMALGDDTADFTYNEGDDPSEPRVRHLPALRFRPGNARGTARLKPRR